MDPATVRSVDDSGSCRDLLHDAEHLTSRQHQVARLDRSSELEEQATTEIRDQRPERKKDDDRDDDNNGRRVRRRKGRKSRKNRKSPKVALVAVSA